jgi:hypothetical protein
MFHCEFLESARETFLRSALMPTSGPITIRDSVKSQSNSGGYASWYTALWWSRNIICLTCTYFCRKFRQLKGILFINLNKLKAVLRKSTHKCIATYVKVSKKLEFVLLSIIHTGLESTNSRTRQHSMLVIPALLSLKPQVLDRPAPELIELMKVIIRKLRDS